MNRFLYSVARPMFILAYTFFVSVEGSPMKMCTRAPQNQLSYATVSLPVWRSVTGLSDVDTVAVVMERTVGSGR